MDQIIDSLTYDDKLPWPEEADGAGSSLELIDADSDNSIAENWKASFGHGTPGSVNSVVTSIEENQNTSIPQVFSLHQNYPNPFNPITTINYQISEFSIVTLKVYDLLGREVTTLVSKQLLPGNYSVRFDGSNLASGIYIYQLNAGSFISTKKLVLLK